eukprot:TRINITY_DN12004_c0_g2_i1.p1 TRINITY_DN12004_c0_g2~~TRINITY_DN12004_c0_g2_i1.p1  ORF type:complete len:799 (+),score=141.55 TRINITY_DN12004_c0_g2_i1:145-2397(+)
MDVGEVTTVYLVTSSHFDAGCKTPGCGNYTPGEPYRCAHTRNGPGEPFAYHIINRYFDQFIERAIQLSAQARSKGTQYNYLIQPWVAALYLNCSNAGLLSWPFSGLPLNTSLLHCPSQVDKDALIRALQRGDMFLHAFPHDGEASYYPDSSLFEAALRLPQAVAWQANVTLPRVVSQRDVPGTTRAAIPLLRKYGINGLTIGAGTPPGKPDAPPLFVWRDEASGTDVVVTYETAYGKVTQVFVLPNGVAMVAAWIGDNQGPGSYEDVQGFFTYLNKTFPNADIKLGPFEPFFDIANQPDIKSQLPVITEEIGDGWLYGIASDPLKNAQFRRLSALRKTCIENGRCDPNNEAMMAFDRLMVKVPEHTWGVAQTWFLPDYENWTNTQFDAARRQAGFILNNTHHADYNTTINSWLEQRTYVVNAPRLLQSTYPDLAQAMEESLHASQMTQAPDTSSYTLTTQRSFQCPNGVTIGFDDHGALMQLDVNGIALASTSNTIGAYRYQSFTNEDYNIYLQDFGIRVSGCEYHTHSPDDMRCGNFRKPNVSSANPKRRDIQPELQQLWQKKDGSCSFITMATFPDEATTLAGAPERVWTSVSVQQTKVTWAVISADKRPTRLPEALFFSFNPVVDVDSWRLQVLGSSMDPMDVHGAPAHGNTPPVYGGSPHLRAVERVNVAKGDVNVSIESLDVPLICTGPANPFPTPRTGPPDMTQGVHYNIFQNIWNTNYALWYPFIDEDKDFLSNFEFGWTAPP